MIAALGRFEDPAAVPPLLGALKAPQRRVRAAAVDALVAIVKAKGAGASATCGDRERHGPCRRQPGVARS